MIQHTHTRATMLQLSLQNKHLMMVTALHSNATTIFSPWDCHFACLFTVLSWAGKVIWLVLMQNVYCLTFSLEVYKFLKIFPHTENPTLCLEEQITETSPLNKLLISKKNTTAYYLSSNCQDTANCNSFRRQSICWRSPKSFPVFENKSSVNSLALHNYPKQPTREVQDH